MTAPTTPRVTDCTARIDRERRRVVRCDHCADCRAYVQQLKDEQVNAVRKVAAKVQQGARVRREAADDGR